MGQSAQTVCKVAAVLRTSAWRDLISCVCALACRKEVWNQAEHPVCLHPSPWEQSPGLGNDTRSAQGVLREPRSF